MCLGGGWESGIIEIRRRAFGTFLYFEPTKIPKHRMETIRTKRAALYEHTVEADSFITVLSKRRYYYRIDSEFSVETLTIDLLLHTA